MENIKNLRPPKFSQQGGAVVGLGPESTMQFINILTKESLERTGEELSASLRIPFVMHYANVPQEMERVALSGEAFGSSLIDIFRNVFAETLEQSFRVLENAECTFAHVHCNTLGLVVDGFGIKERFKKMQVLTIADAMAGEFIDLRMRGMNYVFPIGTDYTVFGIPTMTAEGMYDSEMRHTGLQIFKPTGQQQSAISEAILDCVQGGGGTVESQTEVFADILESRGFMPGGKNAILICCTDLNAHGHLLREKGYEVIDTAESVVKYAVRRILDSMEEKDSYR